MVNKSPSYFGQLSTGPGATGELATHRQECDRDFAAKSGLTVTDTSTVAYEIFEPAV